MTPLHLTSWFRKRMLPLVVAASVIVAAAAPIAYYVQKRGELIAAARGEAARVADVVRTAVEEQPRLWRYDAVKLGERLAAEGLDRWPLRIFSAGAEVGVDRVHPAAPPRVPIWGRYDLRLDRAPWRPDGAGAFGRDRVVASVWVAVEGAQLYGETALLGLVFMLLAAGIGTVLYLLPVRAIAGAERRVHRLLGELALTLQEEDRRRIARDLHDGAGQAITAARLELLALTSGAAPADGSGIVATLRRIASQLDEALAEVRRSTAALGPPALAELGFARALARHCEAFADAADLRVHCEVPADLPPLGGELELNCYRIVQEALTNTARHARATSATVRVELLGPPRRRRLRLLVEDDGAGLSGEAAGGHGLQGMHERVRLLGGELRLSRAAASGGSATDRGGGLRLEAVFPVHEEERR